MMRLRAIAKPWVVLVAVLCSGGFASSASAEIVLSQVIVDLLPSEPPREDIEVWNSGDDRAFVLAEPFEITDAGTEAERRSPVGDPEISGLLVSPRRMILEPGERRTIRVAYVGGRPDRDRVFRLAVKPVAGLITADANALKIFVGYDALVLVRPAAYAGGIVGERRGVSLWLRNEGNTAQEIFHGQQCNGTNDGCKDLPSKRLYPGAEWRQTLPYDTAVTYKVGIGPDVRDRRF